MTTSLLITVRVGLVAVICATNCGIAVAQATAETRESRLEKFQVLQAEYKALKKQVQADRLLIGMEKFFEKKILKLVEEHKLSDAQAARLRVAAKGAIKQHLKSQPVDAVDLPPWAMEFADYYRRSGDLVFIGEWKKSLALEQPIWGNTVNEMVAPDAAQEMVERQEFQVRIVIDQCIYRLDARLKLKTEQRAVIRKWVESGIGKDLRNMRCESRQMLSYPLAYFLSELTDEKLRTVLNEQQLAKWPQVMESMVR